MKPRILVVEDDVDLAKILVDNLSFEGFDVQSVADGNVAVARASEFAPDLILLDLMLPNKTGFELCGELRGLRQTSIVMLTARSDKRDKLRGLNLGADDYVTKPFDLEELLARIRAVLRRARPTVERLHLGRVVIDLRTLQAWSGSRPLELSHREFELVRYLAERSQRVISRDELLQAIWGFAETLQTRAVDHAIARLRRKIEEDINHPRFIHTVHGEGYCLTLDPSERSLA